MRGFDKRCGFSLIEILVVVAILALLMGITFLSTGRQQRGAQVRQQAELLTATLCRARALAMANQAIYAVVFNIQNAPGSSGEVLNNRSGGHWYRIIGPTPTLADSYYSRSSSKLDGRIPYAGGGANFPSLTDEIAQSWVDAPHVLPAGRVRFLALSDTDEGPALRNDTLGAASSGRTPVHYGTGGETTYPRPWFGYFDPATKKLWPWGGYSSTKPTSGFYYQGKDGPVVGCQNPVTRTYNNDFNPGQGLTDDFINVDVNGDGDFDDYSEREVNIPIFTAGEPRPLVNANWLDTGIGFFPDGRAFNLEWNRSRRWYADTVMRLPKEGGAPSQHACGVRDMAKVRISYALSPWASYGNNTTFTIGVPIDYNQSLVDCTFDIPETGNFDRHNGGWYITLAPDARDDRTSFPDAKAALASMSPMYRVFVGKNGNVSWLDVKQNEGYLAGKKIWPPAQSDWLSTSAVPVSNLVWKNCRLGWLHQPDVGTKNSDVLIPRGRPINDVVSSEMMAKKIWWIDE